ncbi:MAG: hypothetical protein K9N35_06745 [Candidatus Marinimicrobia bacterium]|nr:hypothetical protein [Candidatus Neomarinimicrobiota bacterium]
MDNQSSFSLLEWILALSAIAAASFSGLTWLQAKKFKSDENYSRRALLVPDDHPGYLKQREALATKPVLRLDIINAGVNPCINVHGLLAAYKTYKTSDDELRLDQIFREEHFAINPIPNNGKWMIRIDRPTFEQDKITNIAILMSSYIVFKLKYRDMILNEDFEHAFFWSKAPNNNLQEVHPPILALLIKESESLQFSAG